MAMLLFFFYPCSACNDRESTWARMVYKIPLRLALRALITFSWFGRWGRVRVWAGTELRADAMSTGFHGWPHDHPFTTFLKPCQLLLDINLIFCYRGGYGKDRTGPERSFVHYDPQGESQAPKDGGCG